MRTESQLFERKPFITGNWKLNPSTKEEAIELATGIADATTDASPGDVGLFVPFPFIETVQKIAGDKFVVGAEVSTDFWKSASMPRLCILHAACSCPDGHP